MYERSAIVLERYFEQFFGFNKQNNLVTNYKNYCDLFEKFKVLQKANSEEFEALEAFKTSESEIEAIQGQEEKLYKKIAKLEYGRDIVFGDITQSPEDIEKCIVKIEEDIAKAQNSYISLREKFVQAVISYNERKAELTKCKKARKTAEAEYNASFDFTRQNIENIPEEFIEIAKNFGENGDEEELVGTMIENGKDEKIPFNNSVIRNAVRVSFDIQRRFIDCYVDCYLKTQKLIDELLEGAVSVELHEKTIRNVNVKMSFLLAEKDYIVQFLDYERIMVIHGKRTHRNLMLEACDNFNVDVEQINNLYTLLQKEILKKSTKKAYKELYNKSYLIDIEENDEKFKKEKNKINLSTATVMNTNYWRIEGIKNIYTVFYKNVVEVFGKDLDEFEVPKDPDEMDEEMSYETSDSQIQEFDEENVVTSKRAKKASKVESISEDMPVLPGLDFEEEPKKPAKPVDIEVEAFKKAGEEILEAPSELDKKPVKKAVKRYTRKKVPAKVANIVEEPKNFMDVFDEVEDDQEPDIFGEKYRDIDAKIVELEALDELDEVKGISPDKVFEEMRAINSKGKNKKVEAEELFEEVEASKEIAKANQDEELKEEKIQKVEKSKKSKKTKKIQEIEKEDFDEDFEDEMPYEEDDDIPFEEESMFDDIETNEFYDEISLKKDGKGKKNKKSGILKNIMKLNSKDKKKVTAN